MKRLMMYSADPSICRASLLVPISLSIGRII